MKNLAIALRKFQKKDTREAAEMCSQTVISVNATDYDPEQIQRWSIVIKSKKNWQARLETQFCLIAEYKNQIVGIGTQTPYGYLDMLYVHKDYQHRGIGSLLLASLLDQAHSDALEIITTEASITARLFFEKHGFRVIEKQKKILGGIPFVNFKMEKELSGT